MPDETNPYAYNPAPTPPQQPVWPPPPTVDTSVAGSPIPYLPFLFKYNRVAGKMSDIREGVLGLAPDGFVVNGKALPNAGIRILMRIGLGAIGSAIIRHALLQPIILFVPSQDITQIIIESRRRRGGIAYNLLNKNGKMVQYCLCFQLAPDSFPVFASWAGHIAAAKTTEGRLKSGTTPATWIAVILIYAIIIGFVIFASTMSHSR